MIASNQQRSADYYERNPNILKFPSLLEQSGELDPQGKITLRAYYEQVLLPELKHELAPRSLAEDKHALNRWEECTDNPDIRDVTAETLVAFRDALLPGRSPGHVNKIWRELKAIFSAAADDQVIQAVPRLSRRMSSRLVKAPPKRQRQTLSEAELERLWKACRSATYPHGGQFPAPLLWRVILVLQWTYGQRTHDLLKLRWEDIRFGDKLIQFDAMKTSKLQGLPMTPLVERHLRSIKGHADAVFPRFKTKGCFLQKTGTWKRGYYTTWRHEIEEQAQLDSPVLIKHFRERVVTQYNAIEPGLGSWIAGHSVPGVSAQHYDLPTNRIREAICSAPVPECFRDVHSTKLLFPINELVGLT